MYCLRYQMAGFSRGDQRSNGSDGRSSLDDREIDSTTFTSTELIEYMHSLGVPLPRVGWAPPTTSILALTSSPMIRHNATLQSSTARQVQCNAPGITN